MRIENWKLRIGQIKFVNSQFPILNSHPRRRKGNAIIARIVERVTA